MFLAVSQYEEPVALKLVVFEGAAEQVEVLVEQRLGGDVKRNGGIRLPYVAAAYFHQPEVGGGLAELRRAYQLHFLAHLLAHGLLLHLSKALHPLGHSLPREPLVVYLGNRVVHKHKVAHHEDGLCRQERKQRHTVFGHAGQLGHNLHAVAAVARELRLHFKRAYGIYLVAKEIEAERILATVRKDIEDAAAARKLARFIYVVDLAEAKVAQRPGQLRHIGLLPCGQLYAPAVESLARYHQLGNGLGIRDDEQLGGDNREL